MTLALLVDFEVESEHADDFADAICRNARASVNDEPGCLRFDVCRDPQAAHRFFLYELYEDQAAIALHMAAPHFLVFDALTKPWVTHKAVRLHALVTS
jgi:autoinducer 2-degrading protein